MKPLQLLSRKLSIIAFVLFFISTVAYSQDRTADSTALVALYNNMGGASWSNSDGWPDTGTIDTWFGVSFDGTRVVSLSLGANNLTGTVPIEIGNLDALQQLYLNENQITSIPDEIGNLVSLSDLVVGDNLITALPAGLGNLDGLVFLDAGDNQLTTIPNEISNLINLTTLELDYNQITSLPTVIDGLTALTDLQLDGNQLSTLPVELFNISSLRILDLAENQFTTVPTGIDGLAFLESLDFGDNQLSGAFPAEVLLLDSLRELNLGRNQLTGAIPAGISNFTKLIQLTLDQNQFTGNIPTTINSLSFLEIFEVGNNQLSGNIPTEVGTLDSLRFLDLSVNGFTGALPASFTGLANLETLVINDNSLTGLPDLTSLTDLNEVYLSGNLIPEADLLTNQTILDSNINQEQFITAAPFTYNVSSSTFGYSTLSAPTTVTLSDDSVTSTPIPIGFDFEFFGATYNSIYISSNGFISFQSPDQDADGNPDEEVDGCCRGHQIPLSLYPNTYIAGYWEDLDPSQGGTIQYENLGSEFIVEFSNVPHLDEAIFVSFQIKLIQGSNEIEIHCQSCPPDSDSDVTTQGIEDSLGFQGFNFAGRSAAEFDLTSDAILFAPQATMVLTSDSTALVTIYDSLGGDGWLDNANWKTGSVDTWTGVEVNGDRVVKLDLAGQNLVGQMPDAVGDLTALEVLNVDNNFSLSGPIPSEIQNAVALDSLILSNARFNDTIPAELGNLPNLTYLDLNNNTISGVPPEITNLSTLTYLDLADNQLQNLPDLTAFTGLSFFNLAGNNLTFEDLDANDGIPGISYSPQDNVGPDSLAALAVGETGTLITQLQNYLGTNSYQWYKDSSPIPGETGPTLTAPSWSVADEGVYYLEATNPAVAGLVLTSGNFTIFTKEQSQFTWIEDPLFIEEGLAGAAAYGAVVSDYDNDGFDDLFTLNLDGIPSYLYRNLGDGTFERTTTAIPSGADNGAYGSAWGDYNNDGFLDLFASDFQFNNSIADGVASIYKNNGDGTFTSISLNESILGAAWGDVNNDGLLDAVGVAGGDSLSIYLNVGTDTLVKQAGIVDLTATTGTVVPFLVDLSGDGYVDLYITGTPNHLYFNDGVGNFIEQPTNALITTTFSGPWGASFEDLDNDGDIDAFIRSYLPGEDSYIFINDGLGNFTGSTCLDVFGESCDRGRASAIADIDNDGYMDIIFNEGSGTDSLDIYLNNSNVGYTQLTNQNFLGTVFARGISLFDYNNDGALDIYSPSSFNQRANMLYQNNGTGNNWLKVKLEGTISNRSAVGAQVSVYTGGLRNTRNVITNSGLHSGNSNYLHFGMGGNFQADSIVVKWPSGLINRLNNVPANQLVNILEELKNPVQVTDSLALVALYIATDGDNWFDNSNWLQQGQFVQDWFGITTENNRVVGVNLRNNNLSGEIPIEIGDLDSLRYLNLGDEIFGGNSLTGSIPPEISSLSVLEFLGLGNNQLSGPIPEAIGNLSELRKIDLAFNQLEDPVPDTLSTLANLRYLGIAFNTFTDLPLTLYDIPALDTLLISGNQLAGPIPPEIGSMSTLKFLNIGGNQYEGQLPPEFGNLTQLLGIRIWDMPGITGNIPPEWAGLSSILEFSLDNLSLSGTIPDFVGDYTSAFYVSLSQNQFSGSLPGTFSNLSADVSLFGNALTDVPNLPNLASLDVRKNRLLYEDLVPNDSISIPNIAEQNERYSVDVSGVIIAGGTVTLTVTNSTLGDSEYQWVKDGVILSGENAPALILTTLDDSHVGVYTCLIQRPGGNGSYSGIPSESISIDINEISRRYASAVDSVTSEAKIVDYQATEILGLPNRGFDTDDNPEDQTTTLNAQERGWAPASGDNSPFIEVTFDNPSPINSIWLFGSAGAFVDAFNSDIGEYVRISNFVPNGNNGEEVEINFPTTTYDVSQLRIGTFSSNNVGFGPFNSIDAVAIGDNGIEINTPSNLFFELVTDTVINIGWSQLNFNDSTNFIIERSSDGTNFTEIAITEAFTRYSDRQAPNVDSIYYRIAAQSGALISDYSEVLVAFKCNGLEPIPAGVYTGIATELQPGFDTDGGFDSNVIFTENPDGSISIEDFQAGYLDNFSSTPVVGTITQNCDGTFNVEGETALACGGEGITSINYAEFFPANDSLVIEYTFDCGYDVRLTYVRNPGDPIPDAPFNLTANVASSSSVHLLWSENSKFLEEWVIERSDDDSLYTEIATPTPNRQAELKTDLEVEVYLDNTVVSGNTYYYRIRGRNLSGDSDPSNTYMVTVDDPQFNQVFTGDIYNDQPTNTYHGSFGDYDADGDQDLYVTNWHLFDDPAIVTKNNYLYQNDGSGVFTKVTSGDLVSLEFGSRGALWADFDNDNDLDIFVNGQGTSQFINDEKSFLFDNTGAGSFTTNDQFESIGLGINNADFDNDGYLDIITSNNVILINNGDGSYDEQRNPDHRADGQSIPFGWTYLTPDLNQDLLPDLVVTGDGFFHIYENVGNFKFNLLYEDNDAPSSRGASFADFDGNGYLDVVIAGQNQPSRLILFDASGILDELTSSEFLDTSINTQRGLTVLDFDNDGNKDLIWIMEGGLPVLHANAGDGTFTRVSPLESSNFTYTSPFSHLSVADVNNDGFVDLFIGSQTHTQVNNLYINNGNSNNYLRVNLKGDEVNKTGIGTQIRVKVSGTWRIDQVNNMNGLFNGNEITTHFGLGSATTIDSLEVRWTSGNINRFVDISANQTLNIVEDVTPPVVTVDVLGTSISSPEITGTIDDLNATLELTINGSTYVVSAFNAGDSTWALPAGTISPDLTDGVYDVQAVATDANGNVGVDDLEGELTITQELMALVASKRTSSSFQANWSEALDVQEYLLDVATDSEFTTFVEGYENFSTTLKREVIDSLDFSTTYYYRVRFVNTADETSPYSNDTTALTKITQATISDFNALETIFNATGGENWTNDGGWTTEPRLQDWEFIELENQRVTEIVIPSNNLTGTFPLTDSLTKVRVIDLTDNALTGIDSLTKLDALVDLDVTQNLLEFDDLEPLRAIQNFSYSDQKTRISFSETSVADSLLIDVFFDAFLTLDVGGTYNTYHWSRNKSSITSNQQFAIQDSSLQIISIDYNNMGKFEAEVRNDSLPDLTLRVDSMFVFAVADFTVDVNDADGELIPDEVDGYLLLTTQVDKGFDTLDIAKKQPSSFTFEDVILGNYLISIDSDPTKYVPTYYADAFEWIEADTVLFRKDTAFQVSMTIIPDPLDPNSGVGTLEVVIEEDFGDDNARIDARRRAAKRKCGLRRKTGGGRTGQDDDEFVLIAYGETDENGEFKFGFLPEGTYRFFVEYPGIPINESSFVQFVVGEQGISDTDFKLEAFASEDGIDVTIERVLGLIFEYFKNLEVYPNPTTDVLKMSYRHLTNKALAAQLVDLSGNVLWSKDVRTGYDGYEEIDVSNFREGIYLLNIYDKEDSKGTVVSYRVIIRRK